MNGGNLETGIEALGCAMNCLARAAHHLKLAASEGNCPQCGWQGDQEMLDCEVAFQRATGIEPSPDQEVKAKYLYFRAGWIAGHTRCKQEEKK